MTLTAESLPEAPVVTLFPRPLERLEAEIVELCSQLAVATCKLTVLIGEFDAAEGWRQWGMRSTAHWLSWQCAIGLNAAREQVRVARVIRTFPVITEAFSESRLSYSKVRAITRIATTDTVELLVDWAEHCTAAQLERVVAGQRRVVRAQDVGARKAARQVSYRWDDDGSLIGSFRLPPEDGARFLQALEVAKAQLPDRVADADRAEDDAVPACDSCRALSGAMAARCPHLPDEIRWQREHTASQAAGDHPDVTAVTRPPRPSPVKSNADALLAIAELTLHDAEHAADRAGHADDVATGGLPGLGADRFQLVIHASTDALNRPDHADDDGIDGIMIEGGPRLHPTIARRISCGCPYAIQTDDPDGNPLHLGRRTRRIRGRLARAVHARDRGHCQAPGCTNPTTEIHHLQHWADGGPTCLTNLISLCDAHHWLVHDGGWTITGHSPTSWTFHSPDGRTLHATPEPSATPGSLPYDPTIRADAVTGQGTGGSINIHDTVHVLCNVASRN